MDYRSDDQQRSQQLLAIVDRGTAEQLFAFLQKFHRKPFQSLADVIRYKGVIDDQIDFINNPGTKYSITPLMIATGKGSYEKLKVLLVHGADPNKQCATGDTALNLAVHRQKYPIVDLLLQYYANPNVYNQSGKTALHRAVMSYPDENAHYIQVLLDARADPNIEDRNQRKPLDEAILANKPGMVEVLLIHDRTLAKRAYRAAIIAARLGHDKCMEILLNYGMDPNISDRTNVTPLHVAVRSLKLATVRLLVVNGADQNIANNRGETAFAIAEHLQPDQQQNFIDALIRTPQRTSIDFHTYPTGNDTSYMFPLLRSHSNWTLDSEKYRSPTAENSSVQNLLDISPETYWTCLLARNGWVVFDLKHEYSINGIRIVGCENQSAPRNGRIDVSNSFNGPWLKIIDFTCVLSQGNKNDFYFPSVKTRFIRVHILDNYGGMDIRIKVIGFFGVDMSLVDLLREYKLENSLNTLLANNINDLEILDEQRDAILNSSDKYLDVNDHFRFIHLTQALRSPRLTFLKWSNPPKTTAIAGEKLKTFSVIGDEGVTDRVKLEEKHENSPQATTILMRDLEPIQGHSLVDFPDYTFKYPGRYKIRVISLETPDIHTPWQEIVVGSTLSYSSNLNTSADKHIYLSSTTSFPNNTNTDKTSTPPLHKTPLTTLTKNSRAYISVVYESDSDDNTVGDTYLTPQHTIKDSPYFFPPSKMLRALPVSQFDNDYTMPTDDDYERNNYDNDNSNTKPRKYQLLTPTRNSAISLTPKVYVPATSLPDHTVPQRETITPTKYKLRQARVQLLKDKPPSTELNETNEQTGTPSKHAQPSQNENDNRDSYISGISLQQKPSDYDRRNLQAQPSDPREDKTYQRLSYDKSQDELYNRNSYFPSTPVQQKVSDYYQRTDESEKSSVDSYPYNNPPKLLSPERLDAIETQNRRPQEKKYQPLVPSGQDRAESVNNPNEIKWAKFEYRQSPSASSLNAYEPKQTQMEFVFKAVLEGSDVPKLEIKEAHGSTGQRTPAYSNKLRKDSNSIHSPSATHGKYEKKPNLSKSDDDDDDDDDDDSSTHKLPLAGTPQTTTTRDTHDTVGDREKNRRGSLVHKSLNDEKHDLKNNTKDDSFRPPSSRSPSLSKSPERKSKYYFGEKNQNQLSDEENDVVKYNAFGHNSQYTPGMEKGTEHSTHSGSKKNAAPARQDQSNYYVEPPKFEKHSDAATSTVNNTDNAEGLPALVIKKRPASDQTFLSESPTPTPKNGTLQKLVIPNQKNTNSIPTTPRAESQNSYDSDTDRVNSRDNVINAAYENEHPRNGSQTNREYMNAHDTTHGSTLADDDDDEYSEPEEPGVSSIGKNNPIVSPSNQGRFKSKKETKSKKPTEITVRTTDGRQVYTPGIIPPRPNSTSTTDITDEVTDRAAFEREYTFSQTPDPYSRYNNEEDDEDSDIMARSQDRSRNNSTGTQSEKKSFKNYGTQSEEKPKRNVGIMTHNVPTSNFGNDTQKESTSTQTPNRMQAEPDGPYDESASSRQRKPNLYINTFNRQRVDSRVPSPIVLRAIAPPYEYRAQSRVTPISARSTRTKNSPKNTIETDTSLDGMKPKQHRSTQPEPSPTKDSGTITISPTKRLSKPRSMSSLSSTPNNAKHSTSYVSILKIDDDLPTTPAMNGYRLVPYDSPASSTKRSYRIKPISYEYHDTRYPFKEQTPKPVQERQQISMTLSDEPPNQDDDEELRSDISISVEIDTVNQPDSLSRFGQTNRLPISPKRNRFDNDPPLLHAQENQITPIQTPPVYHIGTENVILQPADDEFTVSFEEHYIYESDLDSETDNNDYIRSSTLKREDLRSKNQTVLLPVLNSHRTYIFEKELIQPNQTRQANANGNFYLATSPTLRSLNSSMQIDDSEIRPLTRIIDSKILA
ncbi:unnamed protein product [Rotaria magnacalcarata]|uniref:F5/8 type C domain-containing protein n=1 Tax=Rotaria magnacalcarata TaxID=392030 RepID=A0A816Y135_9BILA|nr:unnamed protein product [Rotaria magnacalcarata]